MKVIVDGSGLNDVERSLRPPLSKAITIPFYVDGVQYVLYVGQGAFQFGLTATDAELKEIAEYVADRIESR